MCYPKKQDPFSERIEHLRTERKEMMQQLDVIHYSFISMIDSWNGGGDNDVTKEEMRSFPQHEWVLLSKDGDPEVWIKRRNDMDGDILVFDTKMESGGKFGLHKHSDCIETVDVIKGRLLDTKTKLIYSEGSQAVWHKGIEHIPFALEETILMVYFK